MTLEGWAEGISVIGMHNGNYARLVGFYKGNLVFAKYPIPKGPLKKVRKTAACSSDEVWRKLQELPPGAEVKAFLVPWKEWFLGKGALASEREIVRTELLDGDFLRIYIGGD